MVCSILCCCFRRLQKLSLIHILYGGDVQKNVADFMKILGEA